MMCSVCEIYIYYIVLTEPCTQNAQKLHSLCIFTCSFQKRYSNFLKMNCLWNFAAIAKIMWNIAKNLFESKPKSSGDTMFLLCALNSKSNHWLLIFVCVGEYWWIPTCRYLDSTSRGMKSENWCSWKWKIRTCQSQKCM